MQKLDVAVIGAGPAGLTAGIYLGRGKLKAVIFEKSFAGGQMAVSELIENFPGFGEGISGLELAEKMRSQAVKCGAEIIEEEIARLEKIGEKIGTATIYLSAKETEINGRCPYFLLTTAEGRQYQALAVIIASGARPKRLGVPGEDKFAGRGVSYCAACDAPLFKDKVVVVVGGGDTAVQEAIFLTKYCAKVYLVHRRDRVRAAGVLAERFNANKKIEPVWNSVVTEIIGEKKVAGVVVNSVGANGHSPLQLPCDGVFIFAGIEPNSSVAKDIVKHNESGFIITDEDMKASREGIFACGDVSKKTLQQVVVATGEGAQAAVSAQRYVETLKGTAY